jgi:NAD(P)-dependent dehydrogenase (short-subunit alcohol dehydrogenase family)
MVGQFNYLVDYDGRRVVVTGCASGIGAALVGQLRELGAHVIGLDLRPPAFELNEFHQVDLSDPASIEAAVATLGDRVDSLFNVAGVSSGIGDSLLVVKINFLGTRHLTEAVVPRMPNGSSIVSVSSLAASGYAENIGQVAGLLGTGSFTDGLRWCHDHPDAHADGGYRLAKEAIILHAMANAVPSAPRAFGSTAPAPASPRRRFSTSSGPDTASSTSTTSRSLLAGCPTRRSRPPRWSSSTAARRAT